MGIKNILLVYANPKNGQEKSALDLVKTTLKRHNIRYKAAHRGKLSKNLFQKKDLVLAVGGDGTFIMASHFIFGRTPILGVNSDPRHKEGFFTVADKKDFEKKFKKVVNNEHEIKKLQRLEAYINNRKVPELALNEFYIASKKQHHTARYFLKVMGRKEKQKSSGILISTPAGSNAWIKSAGGKVLPLQSDKFEYLVREPYYGRTGGKYNLFNGILNKNENAEVVFESGEGVLIVDSLSKEHKFRAGDKVAVRMSRSPLYAVSFEN